MTREEIRQIVLETVLELCDSTNDEMEKEHSIWLGYCDTGWTNFYDIVGRKLDESKRQATEGSQGATQEGLEGQT